MFLKSRVGMPVTSLPMAIAPLGARQHFRAEMGRIIRMLDRQLRRQQQRGRSPAGGAVRGLVIEDGEAEGLVAELTGRWDGDEPQVDAGALDQAIARDEVADLAEAAAAGGAFLPLRHAIRNFELTAELYDAVVLVLAVEMDARCGRLVAYLNDHAGRTCPTIGLALGLNDGSTDAERVSPLAFCEMPVVRDGLLELEGDGPAPGLSLRIAREMALRLTGDAAPDTLPPGFHFFPAAPGLLARLVLDGSSRDRLSAWAQSLRANRQAAPLILIGPAGAGRATAARAAVSELDLPLLAIDMVPEQFSDRLRIVRREASWHAAPLLIRVRPIAPPGVIDWAAFWAGLAGLHVPLLLSVTPELADRLIATAPIEPAAIALPEPALAARAALWKSILPATSSLSAEDVDALAIRFRFDPGRIARAIRMSASQTSLASSNGSAITLETLIQSCRDVGSAAMGPLAQKLPLPYTWDELIVPPSVRAELELARTWVRHQRKVLDDWGFGRRITMGRGLSMLLSGLPGTGKTMAAQVLARELALDLYRVDLSQTVNKYIGETSKNIARLFDEARASGAVLFFDEADALFGKRSEVKDAHDRYANQEVGYLLQKMEEYEGVAILASNRACDMDEAFTRRFQFMIEFPMPDEAHRLKIWEGMFPATAARDPNLELAHLAGEYELSGGEIKNIALAAAYLAAEEGRPISTANIHRAIRREFGKNGRVLDGRGIGGR
jgi:ATPase family associated with various cellular activities (AAA)